MMTAWPLGAGGTQEHGCGTSSSKQLYLACERGELDKVVQHLESGTPVDTNLDEDGNTPLAVASANNQEHVVQLLLKRGAALEAQNVYGWTPVMHAARQGHSALVALLINNKADIHMVSHIGTSLLLCGICSNSVHTVRTLVEAGVDSSNRRNGPSPLAVAAASGFRHVVRLLLDRGADPDHQEDATGIAPTMLAAMNGHLATVEILIDFGANPNLQDILGNTALEYATSRGKKQVQAFLRDRTSLVRTPGPEIRMKADIIEAARHGDCARIKELLKEDPCSANACSPQDGATPLMFASMIGRLDIVEQLVSAGAFLNVQDAVSGWTALMQATFKGNKDVVKFLIQAGANVDIQAKNGATAFTLATTIDDADTEMVRLVASKQGGPLAGEGQGMRGAKPNASSLAWGSPSKIVAKAKNPSETSFKTDVFQAQDTNLPDVEEEPLQHEGAPINGAKNGSLKLWWNRMSNRFRNLKLGRTFRLAPLPLHSSSATPSTQSQFHPNISSSNDEARDFPSPNSQTAQAWVFKDVINAKVESSFTGCNTLDSLSSSNGNTGGNMSVRSLSSGYESLILESSGKPQLTLDIFPASHPKLQNNDLLKPVVPPFHLPPGFESSDHTMPTVHFPPSSSAPDNADATSPNSRCFSGGANGPRHISGTATSPMPPGRTARPVAKLFAPGNAGSQRHASPTNSAIFNHSGGGTPSPHSSGGASSVSGVLRLPHTGGGINASRGGSTHNSSLLMSSGDSSTLTAGSDPKPNAVGSSSGMTTGSSTGSGKDSVSVASSHGLSFLCLHASTRAPSTPTTARHFPAAATPSLPQSARSQDSGTLTPTPERLHRDGREENHGHEFQDELSSLLMQLSLERYQPIFEEQEVDLEAFVTLTDEDLQELGIDAAAARGQILTAIRRLNHRDDQRDDQQDDQRDDQRDKSKS
jgi:ankyrin repeat protein